MKSTLYCGDCLELMNRIPDSSIDMVLSDLPYGTTRCRWDTPINLQELWKQYRRVVKENGAIVLFSAQPFTTELISSNKAMYRYEWIWRKTQPSGFMNAKKMPLRTHENIEIFYRKPPSRKNIWNRRSDFTKRFKAMFIEAETSIAKRNEAEDWRDIWLT